MQRIKTVGAAKRRARLRLTTLLTTTMIAGMAFAGTSAHAGSDREEIERLKQEVALLKGMVIKSQQMSAEAADAAEAAKVAAPGAVANAGSKDVQLKISGQVNRMIFYADDGNQSRTFQADNDLSSTRVRWDGSAKLDDAWSAGAKIEVQFESNSTADVTIDQNKSVIGSNSFTERKLEAFVKNSRLGKVTLGQGDTASNGAIEEDLSGTGTISGSGYSALGDSLEFVVAGAAGTGVTVGDHFSNLDGLSRDDRLRYDTPSFAGFTASASLVDGDEYDVALRYGRDFDGVEVAFAVAYWDARTTDDKVGYGGSASVLAPFGTSLTLAYAMEDLDLVAAPNAQADAEPAFWYVKLGQNFDVSPVGKTSVSVEFSQTEDQNEDVGTDGTYWAIAFEQDVKKLGADIYATLGQYDIDLASGVDTEQIMIGGVGTRIKF